VETIIGEGELRNFRLKRANDGMSWRDAVRNFDLVTVAEGTELHQFERQPVRRSALGKVPKGTIGAHEDGEIVMEIGDDLLDLLSRESAWEGADDATPGSYNVSALLSLKPLQLAFGAGVQ